MRIAIASRLFPVRTVACRGVSKDHLNKLNKRDTQVALQENRDDILKNLPIAENYKDYIDSLTDYHVLATLSYMSIMRRPPLKTWEKVSTRTDLMKLYDDCQNEKGREFILALLEYYKLTE
jgi:hypothetical protein